MGRAASKLKPAAPGFLRRLGVVGMDAVEPVIVAALLTEAPLLLIGPHGVGKSWMLTRLAAVLQLPFRHYNASLLNYDDLVGYPLPNSRGELDYVKTPASIWGAAAVFIDEIARCRPEVQNKLFSIIHEKCIQGMALQGLRYRWSAMNPPATDDEANGYTGCEPLDAALADRFAFVVAIPDWTALSAPEKEALIRTESGRPPAELGPELRNRIGAGRDLARVLRQQHSEAVARYVRVVYSLLAQGNIHLSPRRAVMVFENVLAVHAARSLECPEAKFGDSALLALTHSLPHRATGETVSAAKVVAAHKEAWPASQVVDSPMLAVLAESDPLRRSMAAIRLRKLRKAEFSSIVADSVAALPPGGRHALAFELFEGGAAGRLVASVAEQCSRLYALVASPQNVHDQVHAGSTRHRVWQRIVDRLSRLKRTDPESPRITNLLCGLFTSNELASEREVDDAIEQWRAARVSLNGAGGEAA